MKVNWKVRFSNPTFYASFVPAVFLLAQVVAKLFGFDLDLSGLQQKVLDVINAAFTVMAIVGVAVDHTTAGLSDSEQALTYTEPKK